MPDTTPTAQSEAFDPFSLEQAYKTYQTNIRKADQLIYDLTKGARGDVPEHDLLLMAVEIIARMTDNTALLPVITQALAARTPAAGSAPDSASAGSSDASAAAGPPSSGAQKDAPSADAAEPSASSAPVREGSAL